MPPRPILATREALLTALKAEAATLRDRDAHLARLDRQRALAEEQQFPEAARKAIEAERARVAALVADPLLERKIDVLSRWITVEREYQQLFVTPARTGRARRTGAAESPAAAAPRPRGRPRKPRDGDRG